MKFNADGYLPEGIHTMAWEDFLKNFNSGPQRKKLLKGLSIVIEKLKEARCEAIYIDGSFVTEKPEPIRLGCLF